MATPNHSSVVRKCLYVVVMMSCFAVALVPLYDIFCEITGLNGKTGVVAAEEAETAVVDSNREITIQFDGSVNSALPWELAPATFSMKVKPGKTYTTEYIAKNIATASVVGQAVPSVAPSEASLYFNKTECFCFSQQELLAGETKHMPVTFIVDTDIPEHIDLLTLSYTFFKMEGVAQQ